MWLGSGGVTGGAGDSPFKNILKERLPNGQRLLSAVLVHLSSIFVSPNQKLSISDLKIPKLTCVTRFFLSPLPSYKFCSKIPVNEFYPSLDIWAYEGYSN